MRTGTRLATRPSKPRRTSTSTPHVAQTDIIPYRLSSLPETHEVCAMGSPQQMRTLVQLEGGRYHIHPAYNDQRFVSFQATRHGVMAAEALGAPAFTAPEYNDVRRVVMSVPAPLIQRWREVAPIFRRPLMRHQEEFCALAYDRRGMINASEQGTGKTASAIALSMAWAPKLTLIVAPKSILWQWHDEWHETIADLNGTLVVPLDGASVADRATALEGLCQMPENVVAIVNYDVIANMSTTLLNMVSNMCSIIVFDESWRIKDKSTQVARTAVKIARQCQHVQCLTGTPIGQGVKDLWSQLRVTEGKEPPEFERYDEWCERYERKIWVLKDGIRQQIIDGCRDPVGMMRRIDPFFYRATKATCLDLPEKLPTRRIRLAMPEEMRHIYRRVELDGEAALGDGMSLMGARTTALRLQQIIGGFVFNPDGTYTEEEAGQPHDLRLRMIGSPKVDWCLDFARDQLSGDHTHRVAFWFKFNSEVMHMTHRLQAILGEHRVVSVTSATNELEMKRIKDSINSRDEEGVQVGCFQIKKVAYGHNLQGIDTNVYYSHTWSHVEKCQSADRSHRFGRTAPVAYWELMIRDSIDETILHSTDRMQDMQARLCADTTSGYNTEWSEIDGE